MLISEELLNRTGASKAANIPQEVILFLNQGKIASVNLTEWLAVNHRTLLEHVLPSIGLESEDIPFILLEVDRHNTVSGMQAIRTIGSVLTQVMSGKSSKVQAEVILKCLNHVSDSVRCWAAFMHTEPNSSIQAKLQYIKPFAADRHFGVREIAWMSIREDLAKDIDESVKWLAEWAASHDENIRRFSVESIRPRGVWCKHIEVLKQEPQRALPILHLLKSDPAKYVQDSVGNWLNDASKTQPEWVIALCEEWEQGAATKATSRIVKKAKRTIAKGN
ncbi:DNA alkylation repair protein [Paenibacillus sp. 481]|uniref:DNA alkylation repair protein n=1 Tax=Paenibacillus sp. 481 TaxID=2835869 RepID=UPI001E4D6FFE|nr:DNA alkylation repair protein [Paenibacillus sp. 481]UHA73225.1 DNA alkylation repair protein [Paenibacillus sp. 481]